MTDEARIQREFFQLTYRVNEVEYQVHWREVADILNTSIPRHLTYSEADALLQGYTDARIDQPDHKVIEFFRELGVPEFPPEDLEDILEDCGYEVTALRRTSSTGNTSLPDEDTNLREKLSDAIANCTEEQAEAALCLIKRSAKDLLRTAVGNATDEEAQALLTLLERS